MRTRHLFLAAGVLTAIFAGPTASAQGWGVQSGPTFAQTIQQVTRMPMDRDLQRRAQALGLNVVNVMWEDTGRFQGSSVGPNISDLTLQVFEPVRGGLRPHLLPVIRHPNFSDRTADVAADKLWVRVGNHREGARRDVVPLTEVLGNLGAYLSDANSLRGDGDLLAERDTHFLVSAQHVFVPLPSRGTAEFSPVLYNYQSSPENPAVMTLLITRQGMSATIIENRAEDQNATGWGQQLFFNNAGQRTRFTAERRSAVAARIEQGETTSQDEGALEEGADMMMLVQVPLVHRARYRGGMMLEGALGGMEEAEAAPAAARVTERRSSNDRSDVERAVIGHGDDLGPFAEMRRLRLVRDERFPIRVTVQFYRATSNGVISAADLREAHEQIENVYENGDFVGSLVVPESGRTRPTDWIRTRRFFSRTMPTPTPAPVIQAPLPSTTTPVVATPWWAPFDVFSLFSN